MAEIRTGRAGGFSAWPTRDLMVISAIGVALGVVLVPVIYATMALHAALGPLGMATIWGLYVVPLLVATRIMRHPGAALLTSLLVPLVQLPFGPGDVQTVVRPSPFPALTRLFYRRAIGVLGRDDGRLQGYPTTTCRTPGHTGGSGQYTAGPRHSRVTSVDPIVLAARIQATSFEKGATPMSSKSLRLRRPLTLLTRVTAGALFVNALGYAAELFRLGPFDPEVSTVVALLLVAIALVVTGWWWTPLLGGLLAGAIILGNPFLLTNLSDPGAGLFFAATVVEVASGLMALLAGIAATVQNYRARRTTKSGA